MSEAAGLLPYTNPESALLTWYTFWLYGYSIFLCHFLQIVAGLPIAGILLEDSAPETLTDYSYTGFAAPSKSKHEFGQNLSAEVWT